LHPRAGADDAQLVRRDDPYATPFHLLEKTGRLHVAQEHHALDGLHVRARRDHVDRDGDAREELVAEVGEDLVRSEARRLDPVRLLGFAAVIVPHGPRHLREPSAIRDLLTELVALRENLARDPYDIVGVRVVLGEDERLWYL